MIETGTKTVANGVIAGSFRDPSGFVFHHDGALMRAVDKCCADTIRKMQADGLLSELEEDGHIVRTEFISDSALQTALAAKYPGDYSFLEHQRIEPITYPYEWSFGMLADAGLATLELQRRLVKSGYSLKDATAYNIQFSNGRPIFIDLPSIERAGRVDVWQALGQFTRMFVFPLMLCLFRGWSIRSYFLGHLHGMSLAEMASAVGWCSRLHPTYWLDVTLPAAISRTNYAADTDSNQVLSDPKHHSATAQLLNLDRLKRKIQKLKRKYRTKGVWSTYTETCTYDDLAEKAKHDFVRKCLEETRPASVLDLGANTGSYSFLAIECGARVVAADSDHDAIENLYRRLRKTRDPLVPVVVDILNPSPGIGLNNEEREPFSRRATGECVFALALLHHLLVTGNLGLGAVCELLAGITERDLVVEFVPPEDTMYKTLLRHRVGDAPRVSLESFRRVFGGKFDLINEQAVVHSERRLFFFRKKSGE